MTSITNQYSDPDDGPPAPEPIPRSTARELKKSALQLGKFFLLLAILWGIFYSLYAAFPFIRPGTDLIYDAKIDYAGSHILFTKNTPNRVLIFGNSQVLSGFVPDDFDKLGNGVVESYNLGLPDEAWFLDALKKALASGNRPTHVIYTLSWGPDAPRKTGFSRFFNFIDNDSKFLKTTFPFRQMPRDFILFAIRSRGHGGLRANYEFSRNNVDLMLHDRGYYFIEGQAVAGGSIPDDFTVPGDTPDAPHPRNLKPEGTEFHEILRLAEEYNFQIYLVPLYNRAHNAAKPPEINEQALAVIQPYPRIHLIGPDYWQYPNKYFSDHIHANPEGAKKYTAELFTLLAPTFTPSGTATTTPTH